MRIQLIVRHLCGATYGASVGVSGLEGGSGKSIRVGAAISGCGLISCVIVLNVSRNLKTSFLVLAQDDLEFTREPYSR